MKNLILIVITITNLVLQAQQPEAHKVFKQKSNNIVKNLVEDLGWVKYDIDDSISLSFSKHCDEVICFKNKNSKLYLLLQEDKNFKYTNLIIELNDFIFKNHNKIEPITFTKNINKYYLKSAQINDNEVLFIAKNTYGEK